MRGGYTLAFLALTLTLAIPASAQMSMPGTIPDLCAGGDTVPAGQTITLSGTITRGCLDIYGTVLRANGLHLTYDTIVVHDGGAFMGASNPEVDVQLIARDFPIDTSRDPEQYGHGIICFGRCTAYGVSRQPTFVRLAAEALAGQSTLQLSQAPGTWQVGDVLVIPDTRNLTLAETGLYGTYVPQFEEIAITAISGASVTLQRPLSFSHQGARNDAGGLEFLPHVANLTRSVVFRSQNPAGVRGHLLFTARAFVDFENVAVQDMGRTTVDGEPDSTTFNPDGSVARIGTNQIGRYSIHAHHLMGPVGGEPDGYQFTLIGNSVTGGSKWAIGIHDSHYGLVDSNVMYNNAGAALMTEDCSESFNRIQNNIAIRAVGKGPRDSLTGRAGVGFFFRGPNNYVTGNVATGLQGDTADTAYGFKYFQQYCQPDASGAATPIPKFPGADMMDPSQVTLTDVTALPILQFENNEVYGATESGLSWWWVGSYFVTIRPDVPESVFKNLKVWHVFNNGIFQYESSRVTLDGYVMRGDNCEVCRGSVGQDYLANAFTIKNSDIQGTDVGVTLSVAGGPSPEVIQDSTIHARSAGVVFRTPWTSGAKAEWVPPRSTLLSNVRFGTTSQSISMQYGVFGAANLITGDVVQVVNYNGTPGDNFRVYYTQQDPSFVVPQTVPNGIAPPANESGSSVLGSPASGLTNAQNWATYGIAIAGAVAPCNSVRTEILGYVCAGGGMFGSGSSGSPPSTAPSGSGSTCATPDPFAAMGGGTCYNGGWLPPGMAPPSGPASSAQPAPASSASCGTPDPFAAMGGGTCYNGGWLPPGMTPPSSAPSTPASVPSAPAASGASGSSGGCTTPNPFAAMGGGICNNGGWLPPGMTPATGAASSGAPAAPPVVSTPPAPVSTGSADCTTPDPFVAMGGGMCSNGGWLPPGMAPVSTPSAPPPISAPSSPTPSTAPGCSTPDPFAAMGGGVCYNGGWLSPTMVIRGSGTLSLYSTSSGSFWGIAVGSAIYQIVAGQSGSTTIANHVVSFVGVPRPDLPVQIPGSQPIEVLQLTR